MVVEYAADCVDNPKQCFACQDTLEMMSSGIARVGHWGLVRPNGQAAWSYV